jgi:hypothetical protein
MSIYNAKKQLKDNEALLAERTDHHSRALLNLSRALSNICKEIDEMKSTLSSVDTKVAQIKSRQ